MDFDTQFSRLFTKMVELAFDYVDQDSENIDGIFIYGSLENGMPFYNVFYRAGKYLVFSNEVEKVVKKDYNLSDDKTFGMLEKGNELLLKTIELFQNANREVPALMKMVYQPKNGEFDNEILYDPQYSDDPEKTAMDGFYGWFDQVKVEKKLSSVKN